MLHRDIKPDNIILRARKTAEPVLVDFGMGWAAAADGTDANEFLTDGNQELGNRFLRLPEHAPGHHVRDSRSDVTMLVSILFYLLSGVAPRLLLDGNGRMPHESLSARFPGGTTTDPRWERIRRIFSVGFQQRIDMRYADTAEFKKALASISDSIAADTTSAVHEQLARIRELTESADGAFLRKCQRECLHVLSGFFSAFMERVREIGYVAGGNNPTIAEWGRAAKTTIVLSKDGASEPKVGFVCQISFENGRYQASYSMVGESLWTILYDGPLADMESMSEKVLGSVDAVLAASLQRYEAALQKHVARMHAM